MITLDEIINKNEELLKQLLETHAEAKGKDYLLGNPYYIDISTRAKTIENILTDLKKLKSSIAKA